MSNAVILTSGGQDSATCLALARSAGHNCYCLSICYGQKNVVELNAAKNLAKHFNAIEHQILNLDLSQFGGSSLTDHDIQIEDYKGDGQIPNTYVPARNTIFLSLALAYAEVVQANTIYIGVSSADYSGYPDCRPAYIDAYKTMAGLATKAGVEGNPIDIITPLLHLTKAETVKLGVAHGVDYSQTVTCYRATEEGLACGRCDSCTLRAKGFQEAGVADPTRYIHSA